MHLRRLLRSGDFSGANGPNWLVCDDRFLDLLGRNARERAIELGLNYRTRFTSLPLGKKFTNAHDRNQPGGERGERFFIHVRVGLFQNVPSLTVTEDDVGAADVLE